jgi:hypothetical protein
MKMIMYRATTELLRQRDTTRVIEMSDQFFEAFPHMNFPYDARTLIHINFYVQVGAKEKAIEHLSILGPELADWMEFYESIDPEVREAGFRTEYQQTVGAVQEILRMADELGDETFKARMQEILGPYSAENLLN